jgi:hypothetical protein
MTQFVAMIFMNLVTSGANVKKFFGPLFTSFHTELEPLQERLEKLVRDKHSSLL